MKRGLNRQDIILIAVVLAGAALIFGAFKLFGGGSGDYVLVVVEGEEYARLSLYEDTQLLITNSKGETNLLIIEEGTAFVDNAQCYNQICVHTAAISKPSEVIVCLPHKVVISVERQ